jgi:fengycin family lipopeptide synthetase E
VPADFGNLIDRPFQRCPASWLDRPVFDIFSEVVAAQPDKRAIVDEQGYLTFQEVYDTALRLARRFLDLTAPGEPIAIALPNGANYPVAMLAALAAGRPYLPLDLNFPEVRNAFILAHSGVKTVVVDHHTRDIVTKIVPELTQIELTNDALADAVALPSISPGESAYILYTSGSTGNPKGVFYDHRGLIHDAIRRIETTNLSCDDRLALVFTPTVSAAQQDIFGALLTGATLFPIDLRQNGVRELLRVVGRERVTLIFCIPLVMRRLLELCTDVKHIESVRHVCVGGERVFASDVEFFRRKLAPSTLISIGLGSSETNMFAHWFIPPEWSQEGQLLPVGFPLRGYQVELVGAERMPVQAGEVGEIAVSGSFIAQGYWNDDILTEHSFTLRPDSGGLGRRLFLTGDLGRFRPDGLLDLIGRKDRQIKIRGHRVEPAEVEGMLRTHPEIHDAAVVARTRDERVEIIASVVKRPGTMLTSSILIGWLAPRLPEAMLPSEIYLVDEIPTLGNFKHDLVTLLEIDRRRVRDGEPEENSLEPSSGLPSLPPGAIRAAVETAWRHLLGGRSFQQDLPWHAAGGDSLRALELILQLEQTLDRRVAVEALSPTSRPSELIDALERTVGEQQKRRQAPSSRSFRRQMFWFPGIGGQNLGAIRLVQALSDEFDVSMLDYLPVDPVNLRQFDFDTIIEGIVAQIRRIATPGQPLRLLGYSFGGIVAFEAARILSAEAAEVEFIGIIDAPADVVGVVPPFLLGEPVVQLLRSARLRWFRRKSLLRLFELLVERQLRRSHFALLQTLWRFVNFMRLTRAATILRMSATLHIRGMALSMHALTGHLPRLCLIRANDANDWRDAPPDLRWAPYFDEVILWTIPGDHNSIFDAANIETTKNAILAAWAACHPVGARDERPDSVALNNICATQG